MQHRQFLLTPGFWNQSSWHTPLWRHIWSGVNQRPPLLPPQLCFAPDFLTSSHDLHESWLPHRAAMSNKRLHVDHDLARSLTGTQAVHMVSKGSVLLHPAAFYFILIFVISVRISGYTRRLTLTLPPHCPCGRLSVQPGNLSCWPC